MLENKMLYLLTKLRNDKRGVTAVEYGLIAALIAILIIGGVSAIGTKLSSVFSTISNTI